MEATVYRDRQALAQRLAYLPAVMDWFSRKVPAERVSITMDKAFCIEALALCGKPDIPFQLGKLVHQRRLHRCAARNRTWISMDGKGAGGTRAIVDDEQ
jgi:hypothetical protein